MFLKMKLIGISTGTYEGHNFAKVILTEEFQAGRGFGQNAIISKADYDYIMTEVVPQSALLLGEEVTALYDRFGRVINISLVQAL